MQDLMTPTQVPLGIILKNETKHEEMVEVMDHLHQYVPTSTTTVVVDAPGHPPSHIRHGFGEYIMM